MAGPVSRPRILCGPVLHFRGAQGDRWRVAALFVLAGEVEPDDLAVDGVTLAVPPRHVYSWRGRHVWRFDFAVPRREHDGVARYGFDPDRRWALTVPGRAAAPHIAFVSGGGSADDRGGQRPPQHRPGLWPGLAGVHGTRPFHLLIHGGHQVSAEGLWDDCSTLAPVLASPPARRHQVPLTRAMADQLMDYFFQLYGRCWSRPEVAPLLAAIPSIMMWDDRDIGAAWGTLGDVVQEGPVGRGLFQIARRHFSIFQLGATLKDAPEPVWGSPLATFAQGFRLGDLGLLTLDLCSAGTATRFLGEDTWTAMPDWLQRFQGCRQLLVVCGVPLAFPAPGPFGAAWAGLIAGTRAARTALAAQWRSRARRPEWVRLVRLLAAFSREARCQVTVLSGGLGPGSHGVIRAPGVDLWQVVSAGVVSPPPAPALIRVLERAGGPAQEDGDLTVETQVFPETGRRLLAARTWLELGYDRQGHLVALWHAEHARLPISVLI